MKQNGTFFDPFRIISGLSTHRRRKDMKQVQKVSCIDCPKLSRILIDRCNMFAHCLVSLDTNCKLIYIEMQPIMNHNFQQARSNLISLYVTAFDDVTIMSHRLNLRLDLINTLIDICVDFGHIFFACSACQWTEFLIQVFWWIGTHAEGDSLFIAPWFISTFIKIQMNSIKCFNFTITTSLGTSRTNAF